MRHESKWDWVLDSGASHQMTPCKEYLYDYIPLDKTIPIQAAGPPAYCVGKGTIYIERKYKSVNTKQVIQNVWHVPSLPISLFLKQALMRAGMKEYPSPGDDWSKYLVDAKGSIIMECTHSGHEGDLHKPQFNVYYNKDAKDSAHAAAVSAPHAAPEGICTYAETTHPSDAETPELWH
jgi:hypothetical protein